MSDDFNKCPECDRSLWYCPTKGCERCAEREAERVTLVDPRDTGTVFPCYADRPLDAA